MGAFAVNRACCSGPASTWLPATVRAASPGSNGSEDNDTLGEGQDADRHWARGRIFFGTLLYPGRWVGQQHAALAGHLLGCRTKPARNSPISGGAPPGQNRANVFREIVGSRPPPIVVLVEGGRELPRIRLASCPECLTHDAHTTKEEADDTGSKAQPDPGFVPPGHA